MPIFKKLNLQNRSKKNQKKQKLCRYERDHSLSLLHADYMENEGIHVIAYEDDASRKILSIDEFNNATTDNALEVMKIAGKRSNRSQRFDRIDQYG
jgi:putative transposase